MSAVDVCALSDLADESASRFELGGHVISLVRFGDEVYAIGDRCSHADVSLSEGEVDPYDRTLECSRHGAAFDLKTGNPTCLPATKPVPTYVVAIVDGRVEVELP